MATKNTRLHQLLGRYTDGSSTEEERRELMFLLNQYPQDDPSSQLWEELWETPGDHKMIKPRRARQILRTILDQRQTSPSMNNKYLSWSGNLRVAATLALLISFVSLYLYINYDPLSLTTSDAAALPRKKQITLPDGSVVILKDGSVLDYPATFNGKPSREVTLKGEAFFDIKHDPSKPFIVYAGKLRTTVLGTAFNISAYESSKNITVTVARGKVKVSDEREVLGILSTDQQLTFNTTQNTATQQKIDSKETTAWVEADLLFDEVTFEDAVFVLEKRFDSKIKFTNDKLRGCKFTATFIGGTKLEEILTVICEFNKARYWKLNDGSIVIEGDGCI
jgi:ferric-dicitrate binding protein FerR (iron transport regulator)